MTISIFRAVKNPELFEEMEKNGELVKDAVPGIYHVKGITDLPFQIVITSELKGEEYAAYRVLTDMAEQADVEHVIRDVENENDETILNHYGVLLNLVVEKNPQFFNFVKGEIAMKDALMEMVKDRVDAKVSEKVIEKEQETKTLDIKNLMTNLKLTVEQAMDALGIPQSDHATYAGLVQKTM